MFIDPNVLHILVFSARIGLVYRCIVFEKLELYADSNIWRLPQNVKYV
jgi:hypothetical protein